MATKLSKSKNWTFLSNHGHVLIHLSRHPDARVSEIGDAVGLTERSTQGILFDLQEAGYVKVSKRGRRNEYKVNMTKKFRHPSESMESISSLIEIFV